MISFLLTLTKTMKTFSVPGYEVYTKSQCNRGGVAVLLRNNLIDNVMSVDVSYEGEIWIKLSVLPNTKIGGCYIPPPVSIYFDLSNFAKLHEECSDFSMNRVIMGDLNGRCGKALCDLNTEEYKYLRESLPDPVQNPLSNRKE